MALKKENDNTLEWLKTLEEAVANGKRRHLWKKLHNAAARPRRSAFKVNVYEINKNSSEGDYVIVPGKILGEGSMDHKVSIAAINFTEGAKEELASKGCRFVSIRELVKELDSSKNGRVKVLV
ncbi:MAG: 50S ribosomal protein L18e [Candidatus Micrarchaeaceae archaeon]